MECFYIMKGIVVSWRCGTDTIRFSVKRRGRKMCQDPAFIQCCPLAMASGWLCIAAECCAGAADSQANPFVSCHLSLTTESKKNGRLYRGPFFLVLYHTVFIYYITSPVSFAHSAPSCLVFVKLFQSCQTMWLHLMRFEPSPLCRLVSVSWS